MTIDLLDTVFYTSLFLIPGYIIEEIMNTLIRWKSTAAVLSFFGVYLIASLTVLFGHAHYKSHDYYGNLC